MLQCTTPPAKLKSNAPRPTKHYPLPINLHL